MKKIAFSDKYNLTEAVLSGRKTQTRRIIPASIIKGVKAFCHKYFEATFDSLSLRAAFEQYFFVEEAEMTPYKVGDVIAIAQRYNDFYNEESDPRQFPDGAGWTNKMYVKADLMPHRIRITNVRIEKLQEISDKDCIAEGIVEANVNNNWGNSASHWEYNVPYEDGCGRTKLLRGLTPQETYAVLIDLISGNGTWERNPYVFVYDFELVK